MTWVRQEDVKVELDKNFKPKNYDHLYWGDPFKKHSGSIDPLFQFADGVRLNEIERREPLSEAQRLRLVKRPESPTRENLLENAYKKHKFDFNAKKSLHCESEAFAGEVEHEIPPRKTPKNAVGCKTIVEHRKYSEVEQMWRVRTQADAAMSMRPPENNGKRVTEMLSMNGARKIAESSEYVAAAFGGFTTFCTATVTSAMRKTLRSFNAAPSAADSHYSLNVLPASCRHADFTKRKYSSICFHGDHGAPFTPIELTPETTMQREISRTMDAITKIYQRGCQLDIAVPSKTDKVLSIESAGYSIPAGFSIHVNRWKKIKADGPCSAINYRVQMPPYAKVAEVVKGNFTALAGFELDKGCIAEGPCTPVRFKREGLRYCWVFEMPKNAAGEDNPHIHFMMDWRVDHRFFAAWAARLEGLWGGGYFHLEKIKEPACAGAYMAKSAGYLTKGASDEGQGVITGNRYGISAGARAPDWVVVSESQLDVMGQLIHDVYDHLQVAYQAELNERRKLNDELKLAKNEKKEYREKIAKRLQKVRAKLKAVPVVASKYHVVVKGKMAAMQFFSWLKQPTVENVAVPEWLPKKPEGVAWDEGRQVTAVDSVFISSLRDNLRRLRLWRRLKVPEYLQDAFSNEFWHQVKGDYEAEIMGEPIPAYELC